MTDGDENEADGDQLEVLASEQPTVDAANPVMVRGRKKKVELERLQAEEFWKRVLSDPIGRREIWQLLQTCHTFETKFGVGPNGFPNSEATFFHQGEQAIGQRLYQSLSIIDRAAVFKMHDEHDSRYAKPVPQRSIKQDI